MTKRMIRLMPQARVLAVVFGLSVCFAWAQPADAGEVVKFGLPKEKTMHVKDEATARSYAESLKKIGCEHRLDGHAGHFDLTMSCPKWREAEFADHAAAHKWQNWLKSLGFETRHEH